MTTLLNFGTGAWSMVAVQNEQELFSSAGTFSFAPASVPEPTSLFLLVAGLGLLALVDYVRRQRRQAGMQVG